MKRLYLSTKEGRLIGISFQDRDLVGRTVYARLRRKYLECRIKHDGKTVSLSRLIMSRVLGRKLTSSEFVDHKDRNPTNNTRKNLRVCTVAENNRNVAKRSIACTSIMKGVRFQKGAWVAEISANKVRFYLGRYETEREAAAAYNGAAIILHRDFAVLNFLQPKITSGCTASPGIGQHRTSRTAVSTSPDKRFPAARNAEPRC